MIKRLIREFTIWVPVGCIPILNGLMRLSFYGKIVGEPLASYISSSLDILFILLYAAPAQRNWSFSPKPRGVIWIALSTLVHFGLGLFVFGMSLNQLVSKYNIMQGETWLFITLTIGLAPTIAMWRLRRL